MNTPTNNDRTPVRPVDSYVAPEGVPGFHASDPDAEGPVDDITGASTGAGGNAAFQLDPDVSGRVNTGTGDQPGNTGGARTGTPPPNDAP